MEGVSKIKIPDVELQKLKDPGLFEFMDYVRIIINNGRYQFRIVVDVPTWTGIEGEAVIYSAGNERSMYVYIDDTWCNISWLIIGQTAYLIASKIFDTDYDTKVDVEESSDEDYIRMDTGGTEALVIDPSQDVELKAGSFAVPSDEKIGFEGLTGDNYWTWDTDTLYMELYVQGTLRAQF